MVPEMMPPWPAFKARRIGFVAQTTMGKTMVRSWIAGMIAASAVSVIAPPAIAESAPEKFTVVSGLPAKHPAVVIFRKHFRAAVEEHMAAASEGMTFKWRPAYDGTIAKHGDVLEAVSDGLGDIGLIALDYEPRLLPLQDISLHLPFSTTQCTAAASAYHDLHTSFVDMNAPWEKAGQIYLANITTDGFGLFTVPKIKQIADLRGLNVAVSIRIESWLSGVAAKPFRMPQDQITGSLEAGSLDGAIMPITKIAELKLESQLNNYLLTEFGPQTAYAITINAQRFAEFSDPLRNALLAAADAFVPVGAQAYCDEGSRILDEFKKLKKGRMSTQRFFRSRREEWVAALPPLGRQWASAREAEGYAGSEILSAYMDSLRAAGAEPKRHWDRDEAPIN